MLVPMILLTASAPAPLAPTTPRLPFAHYVQAPFSQFSQTYTCFGRRMTIEGSNSGRGLKIQAMHGFLGDTSSRALEKINGRLESLPNVAQISVSCSHEGELINIESLPPNPGRNLHVTIYLMKTGVEFFPE